MTTAPETLARTVRRAWLRARAGDLAESACLGVAAGLVTAAAAALSGAPVPAATSLGVAAFAALVCSATWWLERRRSTADVVRRLDAGLGRDGAFVCAVECADRPTRGGLEDLLLEREARDLDPAAARKAIAPPSAVFAAAPLVAAAILSVALDREIEQPGPVGADLAATTGVRGEFAGELGNGGDSLPPATSDEAALAASSAPAGGDTPRTSEPPAAATPEGAAESPVAPAPSGGASGAGGAEAAAARSDARSDEAGGGGNDRSGLANGGDGSTMGGSEPPDGAPVNALTETDETLREPRPEAGTVAGRWWPERFDSIVRAWTAERAARERP